MKLFKQNITNIAEICAQKDLLNFIISPGSRSAPLALAFLRHPKLACRTIVDERSAAFIALGLAQQLGKPVGLVCTSGTAALNYSPTVAEACYQQIPLVIFTADRPPEWIDQHDGQTIHQRDIYGKHCRASFELPVDDSHPDAKWYIERMISDAINTSMYPIPGPVHVDVPLREPLYPESEIKYNKDSKIINLTPAKNTLPDDSWKGLLQVWNKANKKLIVAGMLKPNPQLSKYLSYLNQDESVALLFDVTSNLHKSQKLHHSDMILGTENESRLQKLTPDLLLTYGGPVVSKNLKLFLRKFKPKTHWQIQPFSQCIDTFQSLTHIIPVSAEYFFEKLTNILSTEKQNTISDPVSEVHLYHSIWMKQETRVQKALHEFLENAPHCELTAMDTILKALPTDSHLQLGNSFIVRLASYVGLSETKGIQVNSNRGTNGIDGTVSTTVVAAMATSKITTLITGDLAFFYDRNALWHNYLPTNLRIVIINNHGGGIFRILDGASELPELAQHFEVEHNMTAENTAKDHDLNYFFCDNAKNLRESLSDFFKSQDRPAILEVQTDKFVNSETFNKFKSIMREEL